MSSIADLVYTVRDRTDNLPAPLETDDFGLKDSTIVGFLNDAQTRLQGKVMSLVRRTTLFDTAATISLSNEQREYSLPVDAYVRGMPRRVEYRRDAFSQWGDVRFRPLHCFRDTIGTPKYYTIARGQILLSPIPDSGQVRFTYVGRLDELAQHMAVVKSPGPTITNPTLATACYASFPVDATATPYILASCAAARFLSITSKDGGSVYRGLPVDSWSAPTLTLANPLVLTSEVTTEPAGQAIVNGAQNDTTIIVDSGHTLRLGDQVHVLTAAGTYAQRTLTATTATSITFVGALNVADNAVFYRIISVGDYVSLGKRARTHVSELLPPEWEQYLVAWASWKVLKKDSSQDAAEQAEETSLLEGQILDIARSMVPDVKQIPVINEYWR